VRADGPVPTPPPLSIVADADRLNRRVARGGGGYLPSVDRRNAAAPVRVTPYQDGPYLIRGAFELTDQDGKVIETGRRTIALCRCGRSQTRPFCDGTHKLVGFVAPSGPEERR
jgi:CDGSH-type Zn-finger protein